MSTDTLTFTQPIWLYLIIAVVPLVALRWRSQQFRDRAVSALVASRLRGKLIVGHHAASHWGRFSLQLLALICLVVALAGPRYGNTEEETTSKGRNVIIAIDTSRSMLASDVRPDRLTRSKLAAQDLIRELPTDRIGLIAYAGSSFLQAPLTVDHEAVVEAIQQIDTEIIPRGGTNVGKAVYLALDTFAEAESDNNALILFTDGEDLEGTELLTKFADDSREGNMTIVAIGVGTTGGSIIPDPDSSDPGQFIRDREDNIVRSRLDSTVLKGLAAASGGLYLNLNSTGAMADVVKKSIDRLGRSAMEGRTVYKPIDRYRWPLGAGLLLLLLSLVPHRAVASKPVVSVQRSAVPAATATSLLAATFLGLAITEALSAPADSLAWQRYQNEDYEEAATAYEEALETRTTRRKADLHYGAASSAYKTGDFERAIDSYGKALLTDRADLQERSHYSLGNALYREGEARLEEPEETLKRWHSAVDHYEAALEINAGNEDAAYNRDLVKKRIEELEQQQQQQDQQQQEGDEEQESESDGEEGDQEQENQQNQEGDQQNQSEGDQQQENEQDPQSGDQQEQEDQEGEGEDQPQDEPGEDQEGEGQEQESQPEGEDGEEEQEMPQGELEADETEPQPARPEQGPGEEEPNPETGFTRSQARQILRSLADEDLDVRPLVPPSRSPVYKNW